MAPVGTWLVLTMAMLRCGWARMRFLLSVAVKRVKDEEGIGGGRANLGRDIQRLGW